MSRREVEDTKETVQWRTINQEEEVNIWKIERTKCVVSR